MDAVFDKCTVCGKIGIVCRTYYEYDIKCECHSLNHVEGVNHCEECVPVEPTETVIHLRTATLKKVENEVSK